MTHTRRTFLGSLASLMAAGWLADSRALANAYRADRPHIASNAYPWFTFYRRQGRDWSANPDASLGEFAQSGIVGYEPLVNTAEDLRILAPLLKKYRLEMRSLYVNSVLHKAEETDRSLEQVLAIGKVAKTLGVKIVVTNPSPIRWGGPEDKTDAELNLQAANLDRLGAALRQQGITLAYHNHDIEMRNSAREFHHMLLGTDPQHVALCLDAHWIYRGSGNSQVALFDVVQLYGQRIVELHLRQSKTGVWQEVFEAGDIDYPRLVDELRKRNVRPHLVLEQCVEQQSPNTMDAVVAHRADLQYASRIFSALAE